MAVQLDIAQKTAVDAVNAAMDALFTGGAEYPPATQVVPPLTGYDKSADVQGQDFRPAIRQAFGVALTALMTADPSWQAATLSGSWAFYGAPWAPPAFHKDPIGRIYLRGLVAGGTAPLVLILPVGYRPAYRHMFLVRAALEGVEVAARVDVDTDGTVTLTTPFIVGTWLSLDQVSFRAA